MNIDDMQKVNRLAKELLVHGIAESSQDAVAQAEQTILGRQGSERIVAEKVEEKENQEIRYLQNSVKQLSSDLSRISSELSALKEEHERLRKEVADGQQRSAALHHAASAAAHPAAEAKQEFGQSSPQAKAQAAAMEKGYSQEDIAIDKIFYFGKK